MSLVYTMCTLYSVHCTFYSVQLQCTVYNDTPISRGGRFNYESDSFDIEYIISHRFFGDGFKRVPIFN